MTQCQQWLATVWLVGAALMVLLVLAQSVGGVYGAQLADAWSWLMPLISPMLLLIVGAVVAEARRPRRSSTVDRFAYRLSMGLSTFYLFLVFLTVLFQPLTEMEPLALLDRSNLWLGPLQGFVGMALGIFFQSKQT